jgi:signal transduction histidine kinase
MLHVHPRAALGSSASRSSTLSEEFGGLKMRRPARRGHPERAPDRGAASHARWITAATAVLCALVTLLGLLPSLEVRSYASPSLRVALETATTLVALLAAYLVFGRFVQTRSTSDFVLVCALELIALRNLFFAGYPAVPREELDIFATWAQVASAMVGAGAFAAGAFARDSRVRHRGRIAAVLLGLPLAIGAVAIVESALLTELPLGVERPADEPAYAALQLAVAALFAAAALGFTRRAARTGDELMQWFAAGATVAAFGRLNYALFPPFLDERVYTGDVLRLGFAVLLLLGALREIQTYWRKRAGAATLEERRRIARDLHDGLAQELAFIAAQSRALVARSGDPALLRLAAAGERALDESRRAIAALTRPVDEPLDVAVAQAAEEVAERAGARVKLGLATDVVVSAAMREALVRITREAVGNAARHAHARTISVELTRTPNLRLRVSDDGVGFDPGVARDGHGFGLVSMRERVESLGGALEIESSPDRGSVIEVNLP